MTGRKPLGPKLVQNLEGPKQAKDRLEVMLESLYGLSIDEACEVLGIGAAMLHRLRTRALQGALDALVPRRRGRPRRDSDLSESELLTQIVDMKARINELEEELKIARLRHEIDNILPVKVSSAQEELALKKKRRRKERRRNRKRPR